FPTRRSSDLGTGEDVQSGSDGGNDAAGRPLGSAGVGGLRGKSPLGAQPADDYRRVAIAMKRYRGYILDLDGTLYRGEQAIPGARYFVEQLRERGIPHLFLTNNSSRTPEQVAEKLRRLGFPAEAEQVFTSAQSAARFLSGDRDQPRVYAVGEEGLLAALQEAGCRLVQEKADAVVVGIDRRFSYEKLKRACLEIRAGARFVGTNDDRVIPTEEGMLPGNGSLCAAVAAASGVN